MFGPCIEYARACLLLFIIYPGLLKVFESTSPKLMELIMYDLLFSMYMSLILTDLGYHELINFSFHLLRREETLSRSNSQQEDPCPCANKHLSPFSTLIFLPWDQAT